MAEIKTTTPKKQERKRSILPIVFILLLVLLNGFLVFYNWKANEEKVELGEQVDSLGNLRAELEVKYNKARTDLEAQLGQNAQLDSIIQMQLADLATQKEKINSLIGYRSKYNQQLALVKGLNRSVDNYKVRLDSFKLAYNMAIDTLNQKIVASTEENERLSFKNEELSAKVAVGSILKTANINAKPMQVKGSGKEKETDNANKVNKIVIDFTLAENKVADPGQEEILVRMIGPDGATFSVDSKGSGMFTPEGMDSEVKYSLKKSINYKNENTPVSVTWSQETEFPEGEYKVEIYHKNYLSGKTNFMLD